MKKKVQVVILSKNDQGSLEAAVFKTNKERGSFWQNVTGSVDEEESFLDAAKRELREETSIPYNLEEINVTELDSEFFFTDRKERKVHEMVFYILTSKWDIQLCEEHVEYQWIKIDEIPRNFYKYESNYQALEKSLEQVKSSHQ